ncbi:MAG: hypothetical protein H0Z39_03620 [Peptococcaceae bacterium]|nr:hypothetical protein [Peptococcaceae bacterium]
MRKALLALIILIVDQGFKWYWYLKASTGGGSGTVSVPAPVKHSVLYYDLPSSLLFAVWLCLVLALIIIYRNNHFNSLTTVGIWLVVAGTGSNVLSWLLSKCIIYYIVIPGLDIATNIANMAVFTGFAAVLVGLALMLKLVYRPRYSRLSKVIR